ncbi:MAG: FkbM family methyltransferase [Pirellulaceae bacterium]
MLPPQLLRDRDQLEQFARQRSTSALYGDHRVLCRILGEYPIFVDTRDLMLGPRLVMDGFWESWVTLAIARFLRPGMRCIDVGANYGYYSILMAEAVGPDGFVLACEPNPLLSGTYLPDNLALCGKRTTVEVCPAAVADRVEAEVDFYPHDRDFATASLAPWTHPHHVEPVKCPLTTVDELARDWQRLDLVKIDAEGAELAVWHGMQESLRRFPNAAVVIELHFDRAAGEVHELLGELQRAGKPIRRVADDGRLVLVSGQEIHRAEGQHWTLWVQS